MAFFRKFTKRILVLTNTAVVILFLLACANGWLHPDRWWFISLLGLIFPLLFLLVLGFFIFWLFFQTKRIALISLVAMIIGWQNIHAFLALDIHKKFISEKSVNALRVLTWNVHGWDQFITKKPGASGHRESMISFIEGLNPDVICFQEFFESHNPKVLPATIPYITERLHYPYHIFAPDYRWHEGLYESGVVIFSKFPITDSFRMRYQDSPMQKTPESLLFADINVNGKITRVFTTHLQSVLFQGRDFRNVEIIKNVDDGTLQASKSIIKKLKRAYGLRGSQADQVREQLDKSPYPVIICGDFNDVPNSYTYFRIRGNRKDAYIQRGFGIGRTYVHLSPTLRIDYIFTGQQFDVLQCSKFPLPYSDHHPVVADLQLK
ncbi:MAG: endonuclease/exonuclease/phosphatase family protein [Chitinophagales bacterium]